MKRFDVKFSVSRPEGQSREVTISTDELDALSNAGWFREYIGLKDVAALQQQVADLRASLQEVRAAAQVQPVAVQQPRPQIQVQSPVQQSAPTQQQPRLDSQVQAMLNPQTQRLPAQKPGYFDINPDMMTEAIWKALTNEQQQQWMQHWGLVK